MANEEIRDSDPELMRRIARGERAAWGSIVARYGGYAYFLAAKITRDKDLADDAVQEAFIRIWRSASKFQYGENAKNWIGKIVCREALRAMEKRSRLKLTDLDPAEPPQESGSLDANRRMERAECLAILQKAVDDLPDAIRSALVCHFYGGMTQQEIAKKFGCGRSTIAERLAKGLDTLRGKLSTAGITGSFAIIPALSDADTVYEPVPQQTLRRLHDIAHNRSGLFLRQAFSPTSRGWVAAFVTLTAVVVGGIAVLASRGGNREGNAHAPVAVATVSQPAPAAELSNYLYPAAHQNGKLGYIDRVGNFVIPPIFLGGARFQSETGLASVNIDGKWGSIDRTGKIVIPPAYDCNLLFAEGLSPILTKGKWGYVDCHGKVVIAPTFWAVGLFSEGLAYVQAKGKFGFIDKTGEFIIKPQFCGVTSFGDGLAAVQVTSGGKWGYIDRSGATKLEFRFDGVRNFNEGFGPVKIDRAWGYIDTQGNFAIPPQFSSCLNFSNKLAAVKIKGKWGYINTAGKLVIPAIYDDASDFLDDGWASVKINGDKQFSYIDREGNVTWPHGEGKER